MWNRTVIVISLFASLAAMGCAGNKKLIMEKDARIADLEGQVSSLQQKVDGEEVTAAQLNKELEAALADYKAKEQAWLQEKESMSIITVSDAVLFNSGSARLSDSGRELIDKIAEVAVKYPDRQLRVEGHTDDVPIAEAYRAKYPTNWELASFRACAVVHYLMQKHHMTPDQLSAVGYGEYQPIADNTTPEGRAKNRRVVIVIGPKR